MREFGEITGIKDRIATVKIRRKSSCGSCTACGMKENQNEVMLEVSNDLDANLGDWVELELKSMSVLKASAIVYLIPLIGLILGVAGGYAIANQLSLDAELCGAVGGILVTVLSFIGIRAMDPILNKKGNYSPKMVTIINLSLKGENTDGK
ncbi:MAG: SoxR reducing system RseC family protein [Clostridiales bacterium]|nr:SoxR reducing system RseC family protein [Clostridiales bacterium]